MKCKTYIRTTKKFDDIFTKEKETKEIYLDVNGVIINIAEQQVGLDLDEPHIYIYIPEQNKGYSMDFSHFIKSFLKGF